MGRSSRLSRFFGFVRQLLDGKRSDADARSPWRLDDWQKVVVMWPTIELQSTEKSEATFAHLRRLFRYGFRLSAVNEAMWLREFFVDGEIYRPDSFSRESQQLIPELASLASKEQPLRRGQCRVAPAKPVLKALGFSEFDSAESFALQFVGLDDERWIFIDSRPELFRREIAAALAAKLAQNEEPLAKPSSQVEPEL